MAFLCQFEYYSKLILYNAPVYVKQVNIRFGYQTMRPQGFLGSGEKPYLFFREQGEIAIVLREPGRKVLILGS